MQYKPITRILGAVSQSSAAPQIGLLEIRTANACISDARNLAIPQRLCGNLWFEGEVAILFADTNVGKSICAVQIADNISKGQNIDIFGSEAPSKVVLYLDFELGDKQFEARYSEDWKSHYLWSPNFFRIRINPQFTDFDDFENQLFKEIEAAIETYKATILIVDNITYLRMQSTESGKEALPLMKYLTQLKNQFKLSLLVLAHTPKRVNPSLPLTINDLAGSKQLANFADSVFCIGKSTQGSSIRYIKQLKARSCSVMDEIWLCDLNKSHNFLGFKFIKIDWENSHLKSKNEADEELKNEIVKLQTENAGITQTAIAEQLGVGKMKVSRMIKALSNQSNL